VSLTPEQQAMISESLSSSPADDTSSSVAEAPLVDVKQEGEESSLHTNAPSPSLSPQEFLNTTLGQHSPEDVFSGMLEIFQPRFELLLNKLSNNQLRKLIRSLIKGALNEEKISDKVTKEAYFLGEKLLLAQMMLVAKGFSDKQTITQEKDTDGNETKV
jgi:hypothetical protein